MYNGVVWHFPQGGLTGVPPQKAMRRIHAESYIEEVGGELRGMFSWLRKE